MARTVQALARMVTYMALLAAVVILPHWIAYTLVPECATEDSSNCYWDANFQGNGQGNSFIDINGTAYYVK